MPFRLGLFTFSHTRLALVEALEGFDKRQPRRVAVREALPFGCLRSAAKRKGGAFPREIVTAPHGVQRRQSTDGLHGTQVRVISVMHVTGMCTSYRDRELTVRCVWLRRVAYPLGLLSGLHRIQSPIEPV